MCDTRLGEERVGLSLSMSPPSPGGSETMPLAPLVPWSPIPPSSEFRNSESGMDCISTAALSGGERRSRRSRLALLLA